MPIRPTTASGLFPQLWAEEVTLNSYRFQIGILTVLMLVVLRLALGFHFLYEGVWKIKHSDEFTAEPFLSQAKGPMAPVFYAMLPDLYGRDRLEPDAVTEKAKDGLHVKNAGLALRWEGLRDTFLAACRPRNAKDEVAMGRFEELEQGAEKVLERHLGDAELYLGQNWEDIKAHFGSLDRFEEAKRASPSTAYQKERNWKEMMKLRGEAKGWVSELEQREKAYKNDLRALLGEELPAGRDPFAASINPFKWERIEQINFAVTYALTAIGLCLLLGLFTKPAALGGGMFMMFVVLTQPAWPTIYPPDPAVAGHALLVNKDFIEMVALFLIASTAVGRWGGLDYFLHTLVIDPFLSKTIYRTKN